MSRPLIHYGIHFLVPLLIAAIFYRGSFFKTLAILYLGMLIDLDHLWANPIFDPNRCSVGFHFLHSYVAIGVYIASVFWKPTRIIGIGLLIHILADTVDCWLL